MGLRVVPGRMVSSVSQARIILKTGVRICEDNIMKKRKARQGEKTYLLKATLTGGYGDRGEMPHRVLAIPEDSTLYSLAESIVESFDFDFDHAFGFYDNVKNSTDLKEGYELFADIGEESKFESIERTKIEKVFHKLGKRIWYGLIQSVFLINQKKSLHHHALVRSLPENLVDFFQFLYNLYFLRTLFFTPATFCAGIGFLSFILLS